MLNIRKYKFCIINHSVEIKAVSNTLSIPFQLFALHPNHFWCLSSSILNLLAPYILTEGIAS